MLRINVGCGATPTAGWLNIDNSPALLLSAAPVLWPLLPPNSRRNAQVAREARVRYGKATKLGLPDNSAEVIYSSHMLEHLDRGEADAFMGEAHRVLAPGGRIRIAVPDVHLHAREYLQHGDADRFIESTGLGTTRPRTVFEWTRHVIVGARHHLWMYDATSLKRYLTSAGFADPVVLAAGETTIPDPGPLDLAERAEESVYVEAIKPSNT